MTGPAREGNAHNVQIMPSLLPFSCSGLIAAQLAVTNDIHAPLMMPYKIKPTTTGPSERSLGIQKAKITTAEMIPSVANTRQTPNLSARKPADVRPRNDPSCIHTTE